MDTSKLEVPEPDGEDVAHAAITTILSAVPFLGAGELGVSETLNYLQKLSASGVQFLSFIEQYLDSTGIFKDDIIGILAAIAKQERVRLGERTKAGLVKAKLKGSKIGRPTIDAEKVTHVKSLKATGISDRAIATALNVSPSTVAKYLMTAS
jgi:DNA invertase Pin-like site-specific DNA recombinase